MTPQEMTAHVEALATAGKIRIEWKPDLPQDGASSELKGREIAAAPITNAVGYLIVLHELGHLLAPEALALSTDDDQDRWAQVLGYGVSPRMLAEERAATAWAKAHAKVWTPAMDRAAAEALQTYLDDPFTGPAWMVKQLASALRKDTAKGARP